MLNLISSLDLWLAGKHQHCLFFSSGGSGPPRDPRRAAAKIQAAASHPKSCELDHNDGGVEASYCEMCAWAETVDPVGHPQIPMA